MTVVIRKKIIEIAPLELNSPIIDSESRSQIKPSKLENSIWFVRFFTAHAKYITLANSKK